MPVTSTTSSVKRWPTAEAVIGALEIWGAALARRRDDVIALGYFGSYARGDAGFGSDLDLVMIVEADPRPSMERGRELGMEILPVPVDLLVYTAGEWERLQAERGRFVRTLNAEARWLPEVRRARLRHGAGVERSSARAPGRRSRTTFPTP